MARPTRPTDLVVTNGWYLEGIPAVVSPHFETISGIGIESSTVTLVDAGTNMEHKFPSQIIRFPDITLTRSYQNNTDDAAVEAWANSCIRLGVRTDVTVVKLHNGVEVFRIVLVGFRVSAFNLPDFDVSGEDKATVTFTCSCEYWYKL
jgi:hypothetical protein